MWRQSLNFIYESVNTWHANSRRLDLMNRKNPFKSYILEKNLECIKIHPDFTQNSQTLLPTDTTWEALIQCSLIIGQELYYNQLTTTEKLTNTSPDDTANWEANCCRAQIYTPLQILGNNRANVSQLNSKWGNKIKLSQTQDLDTWHKTRDKRIFLGFRVVFTPSPLAFYWTFATILTPNLEKTGNPSNEGPKISLQWKSRQSFRPQSSKYYCFWEKPSSSLRVGREELRSYLENILEWYQLVF